MSLIWKAGSICATTALVMMAASTVPSRMPSSSGFSSPSSRLGKQLHLDPALGRRLQRAA